VSDDVLDLKSPKLCENGVRSRKHERHRRANAPNVRSRGRLRGDCRSRDRRSADSDWRDGALQAWGVPHGLWLASRKPRGCVAGIWDLGLRQRVVSAECLRAPLDGPCNEAGFDRRLFHAQMRAADTPDLFDRLRSSLCGVIRAHNHLFALALDLLRRLFFRCPGFHDQPIGDVVLVDVTDIRYRLRTDRVGGDVFDVVEPNVRI
jgi:hypothetical protein